MTIMFPKLFEPGQIGRLKLKNRTLKGPTHTGLANPDGSVSDRMLRYYKEVAAGGVGMIIVEYAYVDNDASRASPCQLGISSMDHIAGLSLLAQTIQANGARAAIQISHAGRQKFLLTRPIKAPSTVPWEELDYFGCPPPDELTFDEIRGIVKSFGMAAQRAFLADFDMVEIHGCHGYLITNFLSPRTNKRTDWYGGSLENRMRFLVEVVDEIKRQVPPDYPIGVRLSGTDYEPDGYPIEETIEVAKRLEQMGVAVIHVSGGDHHQTIHEVSPMAMSLAHNTWAAEAMKKAVCIPVVASGSITTPALAEQILEDCKADFIALGRPLWADPQWPLKAKEGRPEDIRTCIRCNDGCLARGDHRGKTVGCTVNIAACREEEFKIIPAESPKKVAVVGGGPAGMEAARVCTLRGHEVTLYEKRKLGGALLEAAVPEFKADLRPLISYFTAQMDKLKIKVVKQEATPQTVKRGGFEAVIVATGGTPIIPDVPGIDSPNVATALDVLDDNVKVGKKVAIIGSGVVGTEVGLHLAEQGKEIFFIEMMDTFMNGVLVDEGQAYQMRLDKCKYSVYMGQRLEGISGRNITLIDRFGARMQLAVDNVILACGFRPNRSLIDALKNDEKVQVFEVGDCAGPRKIFDAIHEGHIAAKLLN